MNDTQQTQNRIGFKIAWLESIQRLRALEDGLRDPDTGEAEIPWDEEWVAEDNGA